MQTAPDIQQLRADALLYVDNKTWHSLPRLKTLVDKLIATYIDDPFVYRSQHRAAFHEAFCLILQDIFTAVAWQDRYEPAEGGRAVGQRDGDMHRSLTRYVCKALVARSGEEGKYAANTFSSCSYLPICDGLVTQGESSFIEALIASTQGLFVRTADAGGALYLSMCWEYKPGSFLVLASGHRGADVVTPEKMRAALKGTPTVHDIPTSWSAWLRSMHTFSDDFLTNGYEAHDGCLDGLLLKHEVAQVHALATALRGTMHLPAEVRGELMRTDMHRLAELEQAWINSYQGQRHAMRLALRQFFTKTAFAGIKSALRLG